MDASSGLESLHYEFAGRKAVPDFAPLLVGVLGSGNLEVMLEALHLPVCRFEVQTTARGFGSIWEAVLHDFHERHPLSGVKISIHDMGATPAVVSLRLSQAAAEWEAACQR